ncbi:uncharacterized protein LOC120360016 isoform X2 [Solenopsis invicta]|uniref:uncharacterized protein LOC105203100 isoform X2 n=1 Tax=Solenopsis invicta TaxID=13686 RepID=UPI000595A307|nr:uncharacterized protein LOC105203100 isoform X2 [Solenopsis invicta]XP_039315461.1 uncharacterized protein LOC120360016 isoform X2 [Solenopsis invicta]
MLEPCVINKILIEESILSPDSHNLQHAGISKMLIYDVLHKEKVYHAVANDLRSLGVKYRFKKSMLKSERAEACKDISKKVFKIPLFYQALDIVNLSSGAIVHVPVFVIQAATFLEEHVTQEGLFRKAGSQARQKELISRLDNGGSLGDKNHAVDIANCLKSFFRDLPEPLIPYVYHDLFVHCALLKSHRVQALLLACTLLPPYHLNTLAFFMEFLKKVSMYEKQNKMSVENLAKVIGPNIMPLQEMSMSAVQNRLQMHLTIVKILIENSENIGILPPHIVQSISTETSGSTDNGLDSFELHLKHKKKKHRSGSLTRMFNGLKKMVGKNADDAPNVNHPQCLVHPTQLNTVSNKFTKKRKVVEREYPPSIKKKRMADKLDKSKKLRLSLDKFVPKNKQNVDGNLSDSYTGNYKMCNERRWSSVSNSFDTDKICEFSEEISNLRLMKYDKPSNNDFRQEFNDVFINATVDLSDDGGEQVLLVNESRRRSDEQWRLNVSTSSRKLDATDESDNICLLTPEEKTDSEEFDTFLPSSDVISLSSDHCEEDYVRIRKSEYEDIKNRVSAIESRISQEFGCIYNEKNDITTHSLNKIQTAYEKTLEEASIENTLTSDYLAKRLSKELKIRRSGEHKIIRSPSARKIGSLRRRSQEKIASKRVRRTASRHTSPEFNLQHHIQLERQVNVYPVEKQSIYSSKYLEQSHSTEKCNEDISNNMRDEIACLHNQINTLISRSNDQRKISNNSDLDLSGFKDLYLNNHTTTSVRRASSFHGKDFVDNSSYFDKKIDELKKVNSHQNIALNNDCLQRDKTAFEGSNKISWKDADKYFKSVSRTNTPAPQTGRASVAKLRTQNAGMVLAKAKLFDECTTKTSEFISSNISNRKHYRDNTTKHSPKVTKEMNASTENFKVCNRSQVSRKKSNKDSKGKNRHATSSPNVSPQIKMQAMDMPLKSFQNELNEHYRSVRKFESQTQKLSNKEPIIHDTFAKDKEINITHDTKIYQKENIAVKGLPLTKVPVNTTLENPNMSPYKSDIIKTPHIKRPLTVKTPKSSKLVRRPPVDTRRTPLKATAHLGTPKRQSPKSILKSRALSMYT